MKIGAGAGTTTPKERCWLTPAATREALDALSQRRKARSHARHTDTQNGQVVSYHLWRYDLTKETPTWGQVAEHFLLELCGSILETKAFDAV